MQAETDPAMQVALAMQVPLALALPLALPLPVVLPLPLPLALPLPLPLALPLTLPLALPLVLPLVLPLALPLALPLPQVLPVLEEGHPLQLVWRGGHVPEVPPVRHPDRTTDGRHADLRHHCLVLLVVVLELARQRLEV